VASPSVPAGGPVSDTATVVDGYDPTGTVTFSLFGPGDTTCSAAIATVNAALSGGQAASGAVTTMGPGTYNWVASYSGDANNSAAISACGQEPVQVTAPATITCVVTGLIAGPPKQQQVTVTASAGLASITQVQITNGTVSVAPFTTGTTGPVVVTATKTDQSQTTSWDFVATDVLGNSQYCA
jgi:hypothetical protein